MAIRDRGTPGLRRAARSGPLAGLTALYAAAAVAATWPAVASFASAFIANGRPGGGEPPGGDHLQSVYRFWLVGHQLAHGHAPWQDPYSFQPLVHPQTVLGGWPFGFAFWPLDALFGPVIAWNLLLLGTIVAAGLLTYAWLRHIGVAPLAAAAGGLAYAVAPYRLEQSAGHLLGWAALFLPLAVLGIEAARAAPTRERAHAWGAVAAVAVASVSLSGQLHLALGAIPFVVAYAALRFDVVPFAWTLAGALGAAAAGIAVRYTLIAASPEGTGRSVGEVRRYSAEPLDFLDRWHAPRSEEFVYLGWLTPALALAGLAVLFRPRRGLAILLGLAALVPIVLALGTNLPGYVTVWKHFGPLNFTRVPGRLLPIGDLALAALAALAVAAIGARFPRRVLAVGAAALLLVGADLIVHPFSAADADEGNSAYRTLADAPPGRVLELPIFEPGVHYGSVYDYYQLQAARQQPGGYSTLAPVRAFDFYFAHNRLNCGVWLAQDRQTLRELGVTRIVVHAGMYAQAHRRGLAFATWSLFRAGWHPVAHGGRVTLWAPGAGTVPASPRPQPPADRPYFCSGWRGRTMLARQATIWVYGSGALNLHVSGPAEAYVRLVVDGERADESLSANGAVLHASLARAGWHAVLLQASTSGLRVERISG